MTPATARSAHRRTVPRGVAPRAPRRVSGPARPARAGTRAPVRHARPVVLPGGASGTRTLFGRVRALPDHRMVDRLLRSRLWIWVLAGALLGIVAMQVTLLKLNAGISRAVTTTATLERQNGQLEADIARLSDPERVQGGARQLDMRMPPAGDVSYLHVRPTDAHRAVQRMQPPSEEAAALLANGGIPPGSIAAPAATTTTAPAATTTTAPAATTTTTAPATQATTTTTTPTTDGAVVPQVE